MRNRTPEIRQYPILPDFGGVFLFQNAPFPFAAGAYTANYSVAR